MSQAPTSGVDNATAQRLRDEWNQVKSACQGLEAGIMLSDPLGQRFMVRPLEARLGLQLSPHSAAARSQLALRSGSAFARSISGLRYCSSGILASFDRASSEPSP